ncbi:MAG: ribonuclease P protein component 2 [Candidatus Aenigmarchaeota archaeon]|nr:ribonuclease P protein component 2 [Candidatus Aenigmarchaeota archaeon]
MEPKEPKILPPTLRLAKRYIVFEIVADGPVHYPDVWSVVQTTAFDVLGELETSQANIWVIKNLFDEQALRGVIRCSHTAVESVRAVLALVTVMGETNVIVNVVGITGTIESARQKYFGAA